MQQAGVFGGFLHHHEYFCTTCEALYTTVHVIPQVAGLAEE